MTLVMTIPLMFYLLFNEKNKWLRRGLLVAIGLSALAVLTTHSRGAFLAMAGARTYAEAAILIPRSGGEYRYLTELLHPALGYLAGWASLLVGFSAPMAISAFGAAAFAFAVFGTGNARLGAAALIAALTLFHALGLRMSKWTQNSLVIVKGILILAFVSLGLALGENDWPSWTPIEEPASVALPFATSLFFVAYAFSGWNAAAYAAEEFRAPRRDVPRAMLIGCALVGFAYLFVNWILIANLSPERARIVFEYEEARVTLGHLVAQDFLGERGALAMSLGIAVLMVSSTSAMLLVGPRVYAEMARDGFLIMMLVMVGVFGLVLRFGLPWVDGYLAANGVLPSATIAGSLDQNQSEVPLIDRGVSS